MSGCLDPDPSIALELAGTALTASLNVSKARGNALKVLPDGAYVADKIGCALSVELEYSTGGAATPVPIIWTTFMFDSGGFSGAAAAGGIRFPVDGVYYISTFVGVRKSTNGGPTDEGIYLRKNGSSDLNNQIIVTGVTNAGSTYEQPSSGAYIEKMAAGSPFDATLILRSYLLSGRVVMAAGDYIQVMLIDTANPITWVEGDYPGRIKSWITVSLLHPAA